MIKKMFTGLLGFLIFTSFSCQNPKTNGSIRFVNFLIPLERVQVSLEGPEKKEFQLNYAEATSHYQLKPGKYTIRVHSAKDSLILKEELGIGNDSYYTIAFTGLVIPNKGEGRKTTKTILLETFEGATAHTPNAAMPVMEVLLDRFEGKSSKAKVKLVHMAPAVKDVELYVKKEDKFEKVASVTYPAVSPREYSLNPGIYPVELRYKSSKEILYRGQIEAKEGKLLSIFVHGEPGRYPYKLKLMQLYSKHSGKKK